MSDPQPNPRKSAMLRESLVSAKTWDIYSPPPGNTIKVSLKFEKAFFGSVVVLFTHAPSFTFHREA
jgi:hypothetical protein